MNAHEPRLNTLKGLIARLRRGHRRAALRLAFVRLFWIAPVVVALLLLLDALQPLPPGMRRSLAWTVAGSLALLAVVTGWIALRARALNLHLARMLESGDASLQNDLTNAVEFSDRLAGRIEDEMSADLMRRSIDRAVDETEPIQDLSPLRPATLRREQRLLFGAAALGILGILLFRDLVGAVLPRYLDPYGDHPPYSRTRIKVAPAGIRVDYGNRLVVEVRTSGVLAREAELVLEDDAGQPLDRIPMFQTEEGQFVQTIEDVRQPMRYHVAVPNGRSHRYALELNKNPRFESVTMRLQHPEYTRLPDQVRMLSDPLIKGYENGVARLTFVSNRPLAGGELRIGDRTVPLRPDGENAVTAELPLIEEGTLSASLVDVEGLSSAHDWESRVQILEDEKPSIAISSPGVDSFAIPSSRVPIVIEANDDLGVGEVALLRNINRSRDYRKSMFEDTGAQTFVHVVETLDLADLGVRPGDVISYYAVASDSHPEAPRSDATPAYQLAIISFEEYRQFVQSQMTAKDLASKYSKYQERLERLAREQEELLDLTRELEEKLARGEPLTKQEEEALADARRRQEVLARRTRSLAGEMRAEAAAPAIFDIEKEFKKDLTEFSERLEQAAAGMEMAAPRMGEAVEANDAAKAGQCLSKVGDLQQHALERLGQSAQEYKEGIEAASRDLANAMDLIGDVERFKYLYQVQTGLERQVRFYNEMVEPGFDDRVRMKELGENQAEVRRELEQLAEDLRAHADEAQETLPKVADDGRKIAEEIGKREIPGFMQQAGDRLDAADGPGAHPPAAKALAQMKAMISFCESAGGEGQECELRLKIQMSSRGMNMGNTLAQMRAGLGANMGRFGAQGRGQGGYMGSAAQFAMFGTEQFGAPTQDSQIAGAGGQADAQAGTDREGLARSFEELAMTSDEDRAVKIGRGERVMEDYRVLIEAYFHGLAQEP